MSWKQEAARELLMGEEAQKAGNEGRTRTCARRAVGIAASHLQNIDASYELGGDFMTQVRTIAADGRFRAETQEAAFRLGSRISADFSSASLDPIGDARIIIRDLSERIEALPDRPS